MINLAYRRRTWSVSQRAAESAGGGPGDGSQPNSDGSRDPGAESLVDGHRAVQSLNKSVSAQHGLSMGNFGGGPSPRKLQIVRSRSSNYGSMSQSSAGQSSAGGRSTQRTVGERFLELLFQLLFNNIPYLDDQWRASRQLERCEILWGFWVAVFGLLTLTVGTTVIGLAVVGQEQVLALPSTYKEYQCSVSSGDIVEYSLEGYVESHWVPLQVSVLDPHDNTSVLAANVTGVSGGWILLDRFPMPPVHGRITDVPPSESIYSNNVAMEKNVAFQWVDNHVGRVFPCLVPSSLELVAEKERITDGCSPAGLYPFSWALDDLLTKGSFEYDLACSHSGIVDRVLVPNDNERVAEASHKSNYGSHFACMGRIVFVNATFATKVKPIADGYYSFIAAGISLVAVWPFICLLGKVHGLCWTMRDERMTREIERANRADRKEWRAAMERSARERECKRNSDASEAKRNNGVDR